jgi:putative endonuclease
MLNAQQRYGAESESLAAGVLRQRGYVILETNYRTPLGEIDIIARDKDTLVFVEVKARRSAHFGDPKWAVTPRKQRTLSMAALCYLKTTSQTRAKARFDVVSIRSAADPPQVEIVRNAFDLLYG